MRPFNIQIYEEGKKAEKERSGWSRLCKKTSTYMFAIKIVPTCRGELENAHQICARNYEKEMLDLGNVMASARAKSTHTRTHAHTRTSFLFNFYVFLGGAEWAMVNTRCVRWATSSDRQPTTRSS